MCTCLHENLHPSEKNLLVIIVYFNFVVLTSFIQLSSSLPITAVVYKEIYILTYTLSLLVIIVYFNFVVLT